LLIRSWRFESSRESQGPVGESGRLRQPVTLEITGSNPVRTAGAWHLPRSRGEKEITAAYEVAVEGSSPSGSADQ
jgi:hypothetical protein